MYQPAAFRVDHEPALFDLIKRRPLGLFISYGANGLSANPAPFLADENARVLRTHFARLNRDVVDLEQGSDVLVVFSDVDGYVSPSWYASKSIHEKVVPTWNYACVQVRGRASVRNDRAFIQRQIEDMTQWREKDRSKPWSVSDAPENFIDLQMKAIVGVEVTILAMEGKWKVSQNRSPDDRTGVVSGFRAQGDAAGFAMAKMVAAPPSQNTQKHNK